MNYGSLAATATKFVGEYGQLVTLRDKTYSADATTPGALADAPFEPDVRECELSAIVIPMSLQEQLALGTVERQHIRKLLLAPTTEGAPLPFEPAATDELEFGRDPVTQQPLVWFVKTVDPVSPAGVPLAYRVVVTR